MNSNGFISLKLGQRVIFQHPLSQLKQITTTFIKENKKRTSRNWMYYQSLSQISK